MVGSGDDMDDKFAQVEKQFFNRLFYLKGHGVVSANPMLAGMVAAVEALCVAPNLNEQFVSLLEKLNISELKMLSTAGIGSKDKHLREIAKTIAVAFVYAQEEAVLESMRQGIAGVSSLFKDGVALLYMSRYRQGDKLQHAQFASEVIELIATTAHERGRGSGLPAQGRLNCSSCRDSSAHALRQLPQSVRGKKRHKLSPRRALAGSSSVAARGWWPR